MRKVALILMLSLLGSLANAALMPIDLATHDHQAALVHAQHDGCQDTADAAAADRNGTMHHTITLGHSCCVVIALESSPPWFGIVATDQVYSPGVSVQPSLEVFPAIFKPPKRYL